MKNTFHVGAATAAALVVATVAIGGCSGSTESNAQGTEALTTSSSGGPPICPAGTCCYYGGGWPYPNDVVESKMRSYGCVTPRNVGFTNPGASICTPPQFRAEPAGDLHLASGTSGATYWFLTACPNDTALTDFLGQYACYAPDYPTVIASTKLPCAPQPSPSWGTNYVYVAFDPNCPGCGVRF